mmetsp:Transcript_22603/g.65125  ORF Transcript_22603/g.65125 Transcript_22603/m.65125 type:complete len:211 (+) Transcript_22603:449-1081(+)
MFRRASRSACFAVKTSVPKRWSGFTGFECSCRFFVTAPAATKGFLGCAFVFDPLWPQRISRCGISMSLLRSASPPTGGRRWRSSRLGASSFSRSASRSLRASLASKELCDVAVEIESSELASELPSEENSSSLSSRSLFIMASSASLGETLTRCTLSERRFGDGRSAWPATLWPPRGRRLRSPSTIGSSTFCRGLARSPEELEELAPPAP